MDDGFTNAMGIFRKFSLNDFRNDHTVVCKSGDCACLAMCYRHSLFPQFYAFFYDPKTFEKYPEVRKEHVERLQNDAYLELLSQNISHISKFSERNLSEAVYELIESHIKESQNLPIEK